MKVFLAIMAILVLMIAGLVGTPAAKRYWQGFAPPEFRTVEVSRGKITTMIRATGTVRPRQAVQVGSFVSGPIDKLYVDFNDMVKKGDLLAKIDPRLIDAEVARDRATLATAQAEVRRVTALLQQAKNEETRGLALQQEHKDFIAASELDKLKFTRASIEAQLAVAEAGVQQAEAKLKSSEANLTFCEIRSPVDGVVIDRRVDQGQVMAAAFATPILFVVAPDLGGEMDVFAKVDEADIGLVSEAQQAGLPVHLTVDAYPEREFEGRVRQVRSNATAPESVVAFTVVVTTKNIDQKLLPGMTANLTFETKVKENVLRIPNAAIRYYPPSENVRPEDRQLLDADKGGDGTPDAAEPSERSDALNRPRNRRQVWVPDGRQLRAIEVGVGLSDDGYTEITSGELAAGDVAVIGIGP